MQPDPFDAVDAAQPAQQLAELPLAVQVEPVIGRVLRDDDQLPGSSGRELFRLGDQSVHRDRYVPAPDQRDRAVAAPAVAAFRDFQIGVMPGSRQHPLSREMFAPLSADRGDYVGHIPHAEVVVHFRNLRPQLFLVAFRQASHHEQALDFSPVLGRDEGKDRVDRLLLRVADESAGIDDDDFRVGRIRVVHDFEAVVPQLGHQVLRVDPVFGASERDDVDLAFHGWVFVRCKNS